MGIDQQVAKSDVVVQAPMSAELDLIRLGFRCQIQSPYLLLQ